MSRKSTSLPVSALGDSISRIFSDAQERLSYQTSDLSLGSLSGMTSILRPNQKPAINLDPDFQRRKRWTPAKQSALIESFLLNVPVPPIYLAEDEFGQYSVVDGKQRLTAIQAFMVDGLRLSGLENFKELEGLGFKDLPPEVQSALEIRPYVRVVTLLKRSDPSIKFEVFTRLNRGGEDMLPQELRKVAYRGLLSDAVYSIAEESVPLRRQLKIITPLSQPYIRMEDAEYVLRFLALSASWRNFSGNLRQELDNFMRVNQTAKASVVASLRNKFETAIETCDAIWGEHTFQRYAGSQWRSQFLGGMYDAEMIAVSELSEVQRREAILNKDAIVEATAALFAIPEFDRAVRQQTNTPSFVRTRIDMILNTIRSL